MGIRTRETTEYFPKAKNSEQTLRLPTASTTSNNKNITTTPAVLPAVVNTTPLTVEIHEDNVISKEITTVPIKENQTNSTVESKGNKLKNGIMKANKKMKRGMRIMMERTNKILERSRNCKKHTKKPIVKPRILPARASARLSVRKNSGDSNDQGNGYSDEPLRTVELIKRPLTFRDPATKLLYLASLGLYPKSDPESDSTPIVIINEEVFSPGGKKAKLRSMELPLMPNWRNMFSPPTHRATFADNFMLLKVAPPISSHSVKLPGNKSSEPPATKRKTVKPKLPTPPLMTNNSTSLIKEVTVSVNDLPNDENENKANIYKPLKSTVPKSTRAPASKKVSRTLSASKNQNISAHKVSNSSTNSNDTLLLTNTQESKSESSTITNEAAQVSLSKELLFALNASSTIVSKASMSNSISNAPFTSMSYTPPATTSTAVTTDTTPFPTATNANIPILSSKISINAAPLTQHNILSFGSKDLTGTIINPVEPSKKVAGIKRKRKSLETIIKEIPKSKADKNDVYSNHLIQPKNERYTTLPVVGSQSLNPILEELMKKPVKKRAPKKQLTSADQFQISNAQILPKPISMTVPLQPAPELPNLNGGILIKESKKQRNKKSKQMFQLPMPMPIPIPPGLLNFASLLPKSDMPSVAQKPKKQRKPRIKKPLEISNNSLQPILPRPSVQSTLQLPYLPSHLEAFFKPLPLSNVSTAPETTPISDVALDLCVKARIPEQRKITKKPKDPSASKSILKPLSIEEDVPLNLVLIRPETTEVPSINNNKSDTSSKVQDGMSELPTAKPQGNLDNVKQMLARLHTRIAPAVNGVQLITIE